MAKTKPCLELAGRATCLDATGGAAAASLMLSRPGTVTTEATGGRRRPGRDRVAQATWRPCARAGQAAGQRIHAPVHYFSCPIHIHLANGRVMVHTTRRVIAVPGCAEQPFHRGLCFPSHAGLARQQGQAEHQEYEVPGIQHAVPATQYVVQVIRLSRGGCAKRLGVLPFSSLRLLFPRGLPHGRRCASRSLPQACAPAFQRHGHYPPSPLPVCPVSTRCRAPAGVRPAFQPARGSARVAAGEGVAHPPFACLA